MGLHHVILMTSFLQLQPSASMTVVPTLPGKLFPPLVFVAQLFPQMQFAVEYPGRIDTLDQRIKPPHAEVDVLPRVRTDRSNACRRSFVKCQTVYVHACSGQ